VSAARSTTACNWARTGVDGPTGEPPGRRHGTSLVGTTSLRGLETGARSSRRRRKPCDHGCPFQEDAVTSRPRAPRRDVPRRNAAGPATTGPNTQRQRHLDVERIGGAVVLRMTR
jgi:hypothetical protein